MQTISCKYWQAVTTAASITGEAIKKPYDRYISATFTWTDTTEGTIELQHRDRVGGTWVATTGASAEFSAQPNGANAGTIQCNWSNVPGIEFRFVFTPVGGTGAMTCDISMGDIQEL